MLCVSHELTSVNTDEIPISSNSLSTNIRRTQQQSSIESKVLKIEQFLKKEITIWAKSRKIFLT